jgi:uncharacterized protein (TIGR00369 family)
MKRTFSDAIPQGYEPCTMDDGDFGASHGPLYWSRDRKRFAFRAEERHRNQNGHVHGGMLMTLTDQVLGLTVVQALDGHPAATVSLNCDLIDSAQPGDLIEGEARVTRITRSVVFVQGSLHCGDRLLLSASGLWKRIRPRHVNG